MAQLRKRHTIYYESDCRECHEVEKEIHASMFAKATIRVKECPQLGAIGPMSKTRTRQTPRLLGAPAPTASGPEAT